MVNSQFLRAAAESEARPQASVDFFGDIRERLFALALRSPRHMAINWGRYPCSGRCERSLEPDEPAAIQPISSASTRRMHCL